MKKKLIIVLGFSLNHDSSIHSILQGRLDKAVSLASAEDNFLVCGKFPPKSVKPERCETITEAQAMQMYLIEKGFAKERIFVEQESMTTLGNAYFAHEKFLQAWQHQNEIVIVSNEFHMPLVMYCFKKIYPLPFILHGSELC